MNLLLQRIKIMVINNEKYICQTKKEARRFYRGKMKVCASDEVLAQLCTVSNGTF